MDLRKTKNRHQILHFKQITRYNDSRKRFEASTELITNETNRTSKQKGKKDTINAIKTSAENNLVYIYHEVKNGDPDILHISLIQKEMNIKKDLSQTKKTRN